MDAIGIENQTLAEGKYLHQPDGVQSYSVQRSGAALGVSEWLLSVCSAGEITVEEFNVVALEGAEVSPRGLDSEPAHSR